MTNIQLFSAIGQIDDKYIEEAAPKAGKKKQLIWLRYAAAAACVCLVILGGVGLFWQSPKSSEPPALPSSTTQGLSENSSSASGGNTKGPQADNSSSEQSSLNTGAAAQTSSSPAPQTSPTRGENYNYVNITLSNNGYYDYVTESKLKKLGIAAITQDDLGEKIGEVTADNCDDERLIGCEIYRHKPTNCDAFIVVKKGEQLLPFQFLTFNEPYLHDFKELFSFYNVTSYKDITHISTEIIKKEDTKAITNPKDIARVFDILMSIKAQKEDNPDWLKAEREKYAGTSKTVLLVRLHFKNGLSYRFAYEPYLGEGYINHHEFLTKEQNDTLISILL